MKGGLLCKMKVCDRCHKSSGKLTVIKVGTSSFDVCSGCLMKIKNYIKQSGRQDTGIMAGVKKLIR